MVTETDAEHVEHLAFHPLGASPNVADAVDEESWILHDALGVEGRVDPCLHRDASIIGVAEEVPDHAEPGGRLDDVVQVVGRGHVGEELVVAIRIIAEEPEDIMGSIDRNHQVVAPRNSVA